MEKQIIEFNKDLEKFETKTVYQLVTDNFEKNGFKVTDKPEIPKNVNTVIVDYNFLTFLKKYWCEGISFNLEYKKKESQFVINGSTIIAVVSYDNKSKMEDCIEFLKTFYDILNGYKNLICYFNNIKEKADTLSKSIGTKIVIKIEKGVYKTTCEFCENV